MKHEPMFYVLGKTVIYLVMSFLLLLDSKMNDTYFGLNVGSPGGLASPPNFLAKSITSVAVPDQSKCKSLSVLWLTARIPNGQST